MPKRKVSRSQSSNTSGTSKLFPEIATIAKTQATSRSISDFRQSSSMQIHFRILDYNAVVFSDIHVFRRVSCKVFKN